MAGESASLRGALSPASKSYKSYKLFGIAIDYTKTKNGNGIFS
jgi:hypothetical protein